MSHLNVVKTEIGPGTLVPFHKTTVQHRISHGWEHQSSQISQAFRLRVETFRRFALHLAFFHCIEFLRPNHFSHSIDFVQLRCVYRDKRSFQRLSRYMWCWAGTPIQ
jgi:hypothetical protein